MPELRVILLVVGVTFVAVLWGIEWWRSRGTRPAAVAASEDFTESRGDLRSDYRSERSNSRSAPVHLPEINVVRESRVEVPDMLPVIELGRAAKGPAGESRGIAVSQDVAVDAPQPASTAAELPEAHPFEMTSTQSLLRAHDSPHIGQDPEISEVRLRDVADLPVPGVDLPPPSQLPKITLAWPGEGERRIVTLRLLPRTEPRFAGRALRQAFGGAGFIHGPLDIYHLADSEGRVIISAAALAQPGTFDPSLMDSQRFSGLNMFAVLPGPISERECFDELVHAARQLAERLDGRIADQHGEELTQARIQRLRQSIESPPAARAAAES